MKDANGQGRVKQRDIAVRAGVSVSTVSRVLNNVAGISQDLRQQVTKAASELGYSQLAPRNGGLEHIAFFTPFANLGSLNGQFHTDILSGVEAECARQGVHFSYLPSEEAPAHHRLLERLKQHRIGGLLLLSVDDEALIRRVLALGVPVVIINADHPRLPLDSVVSDNVVGPQQAVEHLVAHGHRRIAHLTDRAGRATVRRRLTGYRAALEAAAIPFDPALLIDVPGRLYPENAYEALRGHLAKGRFGASALFCANDLFAMGALHALQEAGYSVPDDVSLVGYDDIAIAARLTPALTTVRVAREEMGTLAVQRLITRAAQPTLTPVRLELATALIVRQSVAPRTR